MPRAIANNRRAANYHAAAKSGIELNPKSHVQDMEIQIGGLREQLGIGDAFGIGMGNRGNRISGRRAKMLKGCL
ncbi:MAG: hypothetical protein DMG17_12855 [Acidobacteria bacterium]|nr:MAG: hypothetical protein DMG17_12855 [Acidobacteriota bacterium]